MCVARRVPGLVLEGAPSAVQAVAMLPLVAERCDDLDAPCRRHGEGVVEPAPVALTAGCGEGLEEPGADDFRCAALREAATLLVDGKAERARRILEKLSDPTTEPDERSTGKAALGAWRPVGK